MREQLRAARSRSYREFLEYRFYGAEGQNRTVDTSLFRAVLYQLSYLGTEGLRSFSAGLFSCLRNQSTPRASYQGLTSDFHIFRVYAAFLLDTRLGMSFRRMPHSGQ